MAIAEHAPNMLKAKNKGLKKMSKGQLHDFAKTKEKGLPMKKKKKSKMSHKKMVSKGNM